MIRLPFHRLQSKFFLLGMAVIFLSNCAMDPAYDPRNILSDNMRWYNDKFEGKLMDTAINHVHPDSRPDFVMKSQDIKDRVSFFDSALVDIKFFKEGAPAIMDGENPEEEFDKAVVMMRYRLSVLPSNSLKNIVIEQEWNKVGNTWFVSPDLTKFLVTEKPPQPDPAN